MAKDLFEAVADGVRARDVLASDVLDLGGGERGKGWGLCVETVGKGVLGKAHVCGNALKKKVPGHYSVVGGEVVLKAAKRGPSLLAHTPTASGAGSRAPNQRTWERPMVMAAPVMKPEITAEDRKLVIQPAGGGARAGGQRGVAEWKAAWAQGGDALGHRQPSSRLADKPRDDSNPTARTGQPINTAKRTTAPFHRYELLL